MSQTPDTAPRTLPYDPWDQASETMWYVQIEPDTLQGLWSEEKPTLYIKLESDGYWLSEPDRMGQDHFKSLEEAKAAGNAILIKAEDALAGEMLADAGLDASTWSFVYQDGARFKNVQDDSLVIEIEIERSNCDNRFAAFSGSDEIGSYASAGDAATALLDRPSPGI